MIVCHSCLSGGQPGCTACVPVPAPVPPSDGDLAALTRVLQILGSAAGRAHGEACRLDTPAAQRRAERLAIACGAVAELRDALRPRGER